MGIFDKKSTSIALSCDIQASFFVLWELEKPVLQEDQVVLGYKTEYEDHQKPQNCKEILKHGKYQLLNLNKK